MGGGVCHHRPRGTANLRMEKSEGWVVGVPLACEGVGSR